MRVREDRHHSYCACCQTCHNCLPPEALVLAEAAVKVQTTPPLLNLERKLSAEGSPGQVNSAETKASQLTSCLLLYQLANYYQHSLQHAMPLQRIRAQCYHCSVAKWFMQPARTNAFALCEKARAHVRTAFTA
eukprot:6211000-Pleurochrysis_carterae.AAC.3